MNHTGHPPPQAPVECSSVMVIQVHPLPDSYNAALGQRVVQGLRQGGVEPVMCRLAQNEEPSASQLAAAATLVLVYPTWGGGLPSRLLQWVHERLDQPGSLANITRLVAVTTHGSSRWVNMVQARWGVRYLRTVVLPACAPGATMAVMPLYKVDRLGQPELERFLAKAESCATEHFAVDHSAAKLVTSGARRGWRWWR